MSNDHCSYFCRHLCLKDGRDRLHFGGGPIMSAKEIPAEPESCALLAAAQSKLPALPGQRWVAGCELPVLFSWVGVVVTEAKEEGHIADRFQPSEGVCVLIPGTCEDVSYTAKGSLPVDQVRDFEME